MAVVEGERLQMIVRWSVETERESWKRWDGSGGGRETTNDREVECGDRERAGKDGMAVVEVERLQMIERRIVERERELEEMGWQWWRVGDYK